MGAIHSRSLPGPALSRPADDFAADAVGRSREDLWLQHRGYELEAPLKSGAIALLDAAYLIALAESGGILQRRQDLPPEAFMTLDDLKKTGQTTDSLRIIAVSHAWLQPTHPDPHGFNLKSLAVVLRARTRSGVGGRWGVFFDYGSLLQHPSDGERTAEEDALFREALAHLGALYSHQFTIVLCAPLVVTERDVSTWVTQYRPTYPSYLTAPPSLSPRATDLFRPC